MNLVVFCLQMHRNVKCPTSRIDCETNFLSILENFFSKWLYFRWKVHFCHRESHQRLWRARLKKNSLFFAEIFGFRKQVEKSSEQTAWLLTLVRHNVGTRRSHQPYLTEWRYQWYFGTYNPPWFPQSGLIRGGL